MSRLHTQGDPHSDILDLTHKALISLDSFWNPKYGSAEGTGNLCSPCRFSHYYVGKGKVVPVLN
jgi:hypothetical protein